MIQSEDGALVPDPDIEVGEVLALDHTPHVALFKTIPGIEPLRHAIQALRCRRASPRPIGSNAQLSSIGGDDIGGHIAEAAESIAHVRLTSESALFESLGFVRLIQCVAGVA